MSEKKPDEKVIAEDEPGTPPEVEPAENEQELSDLDTLQAENSVLQDKLLRACAELENVRNRSRREVQEARKYAVDKFASAIIEVVDNLERAIAVENGSEEQLRSGVQMTLDSWLEAIRKFGIERLDATGAPFDPHLQEAMLHLPSDRDEGEVIEQFVAAYTLHGRLLRPAKVVVSSGPSGQNSADAKKMAGS